MSRPQSTATTNPPPPTAPTAPAVATAPPLPTSTTTATGTTETEAVLITSGDEEEWAEEKLAESLRRLDDLHNRVLFLTKRVLYHY